MIKRIRSLLAASALAIAIGAAPVLAAGDPAPVSQLVEAVNIPHQDFTLDNGLKVIVHEDHKAPIVAVSVWYAVGSKNEPEGKTGYAHLFEHIMFNGSEHAPNDYFEYLKRLGATDFNGTTWLDRTNYFQTVPRAAIDGALFLESDRMGYLLGAVTQDKLSNQIGVVQNEKRQGDNQPYGLVEYAQTEMLFPPTHPYGHTTIGSLADLQAASLDDMRGWFKGHYGPNNAVLVLAGDITPAEARPLVQKWFGDIPRGPEVAPLNPPIPTLDADQSRVMTDNVPTTRIYRNWVVPGLNDPDYAAIDVAARNPNVFLETSGMPMHAKIVEAVERVGPDRVLYGSDAPFHHPAVELTKVRVSGLPQDLADRVLGENGRRLFFGEGTPDTVA